MQKFFSPKLIRFGRVIKSKQGFTLIELTVSATIIAIISTMALVNFSVHDKKNKVDLAAYKLASDIRRVQSYALSLKEFGGNVPDRGWGMYLRKNNPNNTFYIVFADGVDTDNCTYDNTNELLNPIIDIMNEVKISGLKINGGNTAVLNIVFEPPNPTIYLCKNTASCLGPQCDYESAKIILSDSGNTYSRTVKVNKFGLVDVE